MTAAAELDLLLEESAAQADRRARSTFGEALRHFGRSVIIYGAGNLGRRVLGAARACGLEVKAFADANPVQWGRRVEEVEILDPRDAARRYAREALFVVAVWHPAKRGGMADILAYLEGMGCRAVPYVLLFWQEAERCLPYYLWDLPGKLLAEAPRVRDAFQLFRADPESQTEFVRQVRLRLLADFGALAPPAGEAQYFASDLFAPDEGECFVDCGAFDGDTIAAFSEWTGGRFRRVIGFEADPVNFEKLAGFLAKPDYAGRGVPLQLAVGERRETLRFAASGEANAAVSEHGSVEVACVPLDEALAEERVTFLKMDIEGAEMAALRGGRQVIARERPVLALCVYHQIDHLWTVPLMADNILKESSFALRPYCVDGLDSVCYAVPPERWSHNLAG